MTAEPPSRRGVGSGSEPESAPSGGSRVSGGSRKLKADTRRPPKPTDGASSYPRAQGGNGGINIPRKHSTVFTDSTPSKDCVLRAHLQWVFVLAVPLACGILAPQLGTEPVPLALEAWSLNH